MSTLGSIVDGHGCELEMEDGDLIVELVVVAKIVRPSGETFLGLAASTDDWILRLGMLSAATTITNQGYGVAEEP